MIGKRFLPRTLFGRALLILLVPTLLIQAVMIYVFFDRHWDNVTRHMARALAGEAVFLSEELKGLPPGMTPASVRNFISATDLDVFLDPLPAFSAEYASRDYPEFQEQLRSQLQQPFTVRRIEGSVEIRILLPEQVLHITAPAKRLESRTPLILVLWMLGTTIFFMVIAVVFLRNQIRPIRRLAQAADSFGRGHDMSDFRPSGASEVRTAARAFITMRERIKRQLRTRTDMLSGISHDLRTPLTRMKLQLAMLGDKDIAQELGGDVQQMEHMIEEYLDFARGEMREQTAMTSLKTLLADVVADYKRTGRDVTLTTRSDAATDLRVTRFKRLLQNLVDNALRYGTQCHITLEIKDGYCRILLDDNGPGIAPEKRDEAFQPFRRLEESRNVKTGGVGLGLTIARDIVQSHGGSISLDSAPQGGLRVILILPLTKEDA